MPSPPATNRICRTFDFMSLHRVTAALEAGADRALVVGGLLLEPRAFGLRRGSVPGARVLRLLLPRRIGGGTHRTARDGADHCALRGIVRAADGGPDHG